MPELPEVETVRRGLNRLVKGATIASIEVNWPKIINNDVERFKQRLAGHTIEKVDRRGKYLLFRFSQGLTMVSHLRMEGNYSVMPQNEGQTTHTHVVFHLTDGRDLLYNDTRKFGRMTLVPTGEELTVAGLKTIGPEPVASDLTVAYLTEIFKRSKKMIKPLLLDQSKIAGIGNIYADETLWMSKIHPMRPANSLTDDEIVSLRQAIIDEMALAIKGHGTTVHSFSTAFGEAGQFQNHLHVYGREGEPCERCGTLIVKIKVAQRGTHFCPHEQQL
ncbi:bifunctional DNA-formamidopyrimidine glycosylase/DNA-(apurinic or apyrimidinic site) lyase [Lactiplantibacillus sp. WILCCON 0030]|uniref:Formamidopyrimidine-DNA glycosylase n=1 Tax=Lactiplantibacillus brownii TaxID=3069269 RepID=A0ABU1A892_9LACO|nr:bifunctional DNA-formamidopyrimidine glycosylase/DNA-(apurinic or apyrimidinic site) lyase [Lactiplantibacillus brownii]MDQ7937187.1 bifunctional DNA-formamidopyrimidine glycosylase/DNA-(apurinic or apyrimidinic site) lyase [Lactiplantibacillus brownii]